MLSFTTQEAYEKDSQFWDNVNKEAPLTIEEREYQFKQDSIKAYHESEEYKDSMQNAFNKLNFKKNKNQKIVLKNNLFYKFEKLEKMYFLTNS